MIAFTAQTIRMLKSAIRVSHVPETGNPIGLMGHRGKRDRSNDIAAMAAMPIQKKAILPPLVEALIRRQVVQDKKITALVGLVEQLFELLSNEAASLPSE